MMEKFFYDSDDNKAEIKYLVLVIYDIPDNKRRTKFAKFLETYGFRVQKSAFECLLLKRKYEKLIVEIPRHIRVEDNVRVYKVRGTGEVTAWGSEVKEHEDIIII